jgi:hypothetical protein
LAQTHSGDWIILKRCKQALVFPCVVTIAVKLGERYVCMYVRMNVYTPFSSQIVFTHTYVYIWVSPLGSFKFYIYTKKMKFGSLFWERKRRKWLRFETK